MSSENSRVFNRDNLDRYLSELSKAYKKLGGKKMPAEVILIGGAAIIENYGFREMTADIDAVIQAASVMDDAIRQVGDRFNLPYGWLNADFMKTASYSRRLSDYSVFYKSFNQVLNVRTINAEYLVAMKLRSGRKYKNDLSDIIGILDEHEKRGDRITYERIDTAVKNLYGSWDEFSADSVSFIKDALTGGNYEAIYQSVRNSELETRNTLVEFQEQFPDALKEEDIDGVLDSLKSKESVMETLRKRQSEEAREKNAEG